MPVGFNRPFAEQVAFFRRKVALPSERWDDIRRAAHDRGFIVAGAMKADLVADLHGAVGSAIEEGRSIQWFRREFEAIVAKHGWTGWTGEGTKAGRAWRTRVIYQTNMATSYAAGRWQQLNDPDLAAIRPYWRYRHADGVLHPRPLHVAWHGRVLPRDHPFWKTHFPPNGWGCRCSVSAASAADYAAAQAEGRAEPPPGWDAVSPRTGAPVGIDRGFDYAPGANADTPLRDMVADKLIKLSAPIGAVMWGQLKPALAMERRLAWYEALDAWRATGQVGAPRTHVVGAIDPPVLDWLRKERATEPASAEIAVQDRLVLGPKERRHQDLTRDGLSELEWRRLPELLDAPERVLYHESTGHLLYVLSIAPDSAQKIAVEFDYRIKKTTDRINMIVSAYRQRAADIDGEIKGGLWAVVK